MALHARRETGRGQVVDVALYEAVFNMMESTLPEFDRYGIVRERTGTNLTGIVPSNTCPTDGLIPDAGGKTALRTLQAFDKTLQGKTIDLSKTCTNEFVRKALARIK